MHQGVIVKTVINGMTFDGATTDPIQQAVRDALIAFMAATAQAQAEATKAAQRAGIDAKKGDADKYRGKKPSYDRKTFRKVIDMLAIGNGASEISKATGLKRQTVLRIRADQAGAETALAKWGM
jgi:DNA invertase Pin-like site-specific DNA recombinase